MAKSSNTSNVRGRTTQSGQGRQRKSSGKDNQAGQFPLDNLSFDLITIVHEKSKALDAYDRYLQDAEMNRRSGELSSRYRRRIGRALRCCDVTWDGC